VAWNSNSSNYKNTRSCYECIFICTTIPDTHFYSTYIAKKKKLTSGGRTAPTAFSKKEGYNYFGSENHSNPDTCPEEPSEPGHIIRLVLPEAHRTVADAVTRLAWRVKGKARVESEGDFFR
jgi:hypothetical protein